MTPQEKFQIRLNLIDLVAEYVRGNYSEQDPPDEGQDSLLKLLGIYRTDTIRRMQGQQGDMDYLWGSLKVGVRLADDLMQRVQDENSEWLEGWFYGCEPQNMAQRFYNLLKETGRILPRHKVNWHGCNCSIWCLDLAKSPIYCLSQ